MKTVKKFIYLFLLFIVISVALYAMVTQYSYIFSRRVDGVIFDIKRVTNPSLVFGTNALSKSPEVMYSFAVAVKTPDGEIVTASSEDRQWAVAHRGLCVQARFYPYPFWNLSKAGTYFGARLLHLQDCPPGTELPPVEAEANPPKKAETFKDQLKGTAEDEDPSNKDMEPQSDL